MAKRYLVLTNLDKSIDDADRYPAGVLIDGDSLEVWGIFKTYLLRDGGFNSSYAKLFIEAREAEWALTELSQVMSYQDTPNKKESLLVEVEAEEDEMSAIRDLVPQAERVRLKNPYGRDN